MTVAVVVNVTRRALCGAAQLDLVLLRGGFRRLVMRWLGRGLMVGLRLISVVYRIGTADSADGHRLGASNKLIGLGSRVFEDFFALVV